MWYLVFNSSVLGDKKGFTSLNLSIISGYKKATDFRILIIIWGLIGIEANNKLFLNKRENLSTGETSKVNTFQKGLNL